MKIFQGKGQIILHHYPTHCSVIKLPQVLPPPQILVDLSIIKTTKVFLQNIPHVTLIDDISPIENPKSKITIR